MPAPRARRLAYCIFIGLLFGVPPVDAPPVRVFLSSSNPTPCFDDTVTLSCYYPDVMKIVDGEFKYTLNTPGWRMNGELIFLDDNVFRQSITSTTTDSLRVKIDPAIFTGDPVSFTCFLPLTAGGEDSSISIKMDPQDHPSTPAVSTHNIKQISISLSWEVSIDCFEKVDFTISWRSASGAGQANNVPGNSTSYDITGLSPGTTYTITLFATGDGMKGDPGSISETTLSNGLTHGQIAGIVLGVLLPVGISVIIVAFLVTWIRNKRQN